MAHYSCGHSHKTATVGIPNGESQPSMLEVADDGTFILVGPRLQTALEEADNNTLRIPLPCSECEVREAAASDVGSVPPF